MTDFKAENTLDTILTENGHPLVKHYLQDVGSSFGMANDLYTWDVSWEHFYQGAHMAKRVASFGFALSPWQTVKYTEGPEIGKFEGDRFDPRTWRTHTPNAALEFVTLKTSAITCSFLEPFMRTLFETRRSSWVRRGV